MLINCYYYLPHAHSMLGQHVSADLATMAELGVDVVSVCVEESHLQTHSFWGWNRQRLQNFIAAAHEHGLRVHAVPNQWAGLTAGWTSGYPAFMLKHRETLIQPHPTEGMREQWICCVNQPLVRRHVAGLIDKMVDLYEFDGLIWDEVHAQRCICPECQKASGEREPSAAWYYRSFGKFIDEMSAHLHARRKGAEISLFIEPSRMELFDDLVACPHLDYIGSDGHVRRPGYRMHRMKGTIFEVHADLRPKIERAGKRSFFLLEAQRHRDADLEHYLEVAPEAFALPMDHLMFYFSAHEMSYANEARFNARTWQLVRDLRARHPRCVRSADPVPA